MVPATDSAKRSQARWIWVCLGVSACVTDAGCARLRSWQQGSSGSAPLVGAAAPFGTESPTEGGDFYAQEAGKGVTQSRALLAQNRARSQTKRAGARAGPTTIARSTQHPIAPSEADERQGADTLDVALQPPQTITAARDGKPAVAAVNPGAAANPADRPERTNDEAAVRTIETVVSESRARINSLASYQVPVKRQERVGEVLQPAEELLLSIRREPRAVRLQWPNGAHKGREVIFEGGKDPLMHVNMADSVVPVPPLALAPDSPLALRNSRHPITEAGFDVILEGIEKALNPSSSSEPGAGKLTYGGLENPGQLERPCHKIVRTKPDGETWVVYIDPESKLPAMIQGNAANGDLLERNLFGPVKLNPAELAQANAFDYERRWGQSQGLLQRLARSASTKPPADNATR